MKREKAISTEALAVLSICVVAGQAVTLPAERLERKLYEEVNAVLEGIGGKWTRKVQAHVFAEPAAEIQEMLEGCIQTGLAVRLSRNGYFPTPDAVADRLVQLAAVKGGRVLEPSAGTGSLINALIRNIHYEPFRLGFEHVDAIENDPKLYDQLAKKFVVYPWFHGYPVDFLGWMPGQIYDLVIMNPPFGAAHGEALADITHVMHAWELLRPSGRLVSVMSSSVTFRREKKAVAFREHVDAHGHIEELPEKSFKESGTLTRTVIAVLNKPAEATQ